MSKFHKAILADIGQRIIITLNDFRISKSH